MQKSVEKSVLEESNLKKTKS